MEHVYEIAGFRLRVAGEKLQAAVASMPGFSTFRVEDGGEAQFALAYSEAEPPAFGKVLYEHEVFDIVSRFGMTAEGYRFDHLPAAGLPLYMWVKEGDTTVYLSGNLDIVLLRFTCWIAFGILIAPHKAVAIHTSTIVYRDKAVLFLGESGTGKSTHTRLWREHIEGAVLLNDDSPIVRIHDGKPYVYGSPWSGKTPCYKQERHELAGCVRLSQAPYNEIKKLNVMQAYAALHPSCPPDFAYDEKLYDCISAVLNDVLTQVPVYHLACLPDEAAARLSCNTLFGV